MLNQFKRINPNSKLASKIVIVHSVLYGLANMFYIYNVIMYLIFKPQYIITNLYSGCSLVLYFAEGI